jgi:hypothetical protein
MACWRGTVWPKVSHDPAALGREKALLARLRLVLSGPETTFAVPQPVTSVGGEVTVLPCGLRWRATRHIPGRRPDGSIGELS